MPWGAYRTMAASRRRSPASPTARRTVPRRLPMSSWATSSATSICPSARAICLTCIPIVPRPSSTTTTTRSRGPQRRRSATTVAMCTRARKCGSTSRTPMRRRIMRFLSLAALAALLMGVAGTAYAQNGRIRGAARDASGDPVAGVTVRAQGPAATGRATTGPDGGYTIADLSPGSYTVTASLPGLRAQVRQNVVVRANGETSVDFVMQAVELEAVTVTAMLREQKLADIPFSIAAPTEQALRLRGADNIEEVAQNVAGFSVQNLGPGQSQVAMRGASSGQVARDQPGVKEQVGADLDESPVSLSLFTPDLDLFDITRVEVLRGPQGTLFGSGSLAGTVRYISNQPELGVSRTFGEVGVNQISRGASGNIAKIGYNVPLGDKAAWRVAGYSNDLAGWMDALQPNFTVDKDVNGGNRTGARLAVRIEPSGRFSITPRLVYQKVTMDGWNRIDAFNILANPYTTRSEEHTSEL